MSQAAAKNWRASALLGAPALLWLAVFFLIPLAFIVGVSFLTSGSFGELDHPLTVESYQRFLGFGHLTFGG